MQEKLNELKSILAEVHDLNRASAVLGWDQQTYMPRAGAEARGNQLGTLGKIAHEKFTDEKVGKLLDELKDAYHPNSDEAALVKVTRRDYDKATRVPPEFVVEQAQVTTAAHEGWMEARQKSEFSIFEPHLAKVLALTRRYIGFFPKADHPYDTLLDDYEPGMKTAEVQSIFTELRKKQVRLLQAIAEKKQVDDSFLHLKFPEAKQRAFGEKVITAFGFDPNVNRQDKAPHPFCTSFSINDVRITTRYNEKFLNSALFGSMHETGHALYEGGFHPSYERGPLANGVAPHANPPTEWSETKNVKWKVKIPGEGYATPTIWGDKIFVLSAVPTGKKVEPPPAAASDQSARPSGPPEGDGPGGRGGRRPSPRYGRASSLPRAARAPDPAPSA